MLPQNGWSDGLGAIEALFGMATIEACRKYRLGGRFPPGPCRKGLPERVGSVGDDGPAREPAKRAVAVARKKAAAPGCPGCPPGLAALPRTPGRAESANTAAKNTNPAYGLTSLPRQPVYPDQGRAAQRWTPDLGPLPSHAFEHNCTNVVLAWDMRMRGFAVEAAPVDYIDEKGNATGRPIEVVDKLLADAYRLPDGTPHGRSFSKKGEDGRPNQPWRTFADIDAEIERDWPEGGRGIIYVGRHVFNVTKANGEARYIEAASDQRRSPNVTREYKSRYRPAASGAGGGKLIRIDDLVPTDSILESVSTLAQMREYYDLQRAIPQPPRRTYIEQDMGLAGASSP